MLCIGIYYHNLLITLFNFFFLSDSSVGTIKMPIAIERCIRRQNVIFMHEMIHFSVEYFQFIKKLLACNNALLSSAILEKNVVSLPQSICCIVLPFVASAGILDCFSYIHGLCD